MGTGKVISRGKENLGGKDIPSLFVVGKTFSLGKEKATILGRTEKGSIIVKLSYRGLSRTVKYSPNYLLQRIQESR